MSEQRSIALETLVETRGVIGAYEVGSDGFLLDFIDSGRCDPEAIAAVSAVAAIASERIGNGLGYGGIKCGILEFKNGTVIIAQRSTMIWVVVGNKRLVIGDVLIKLQAL